jgi:hypothetical protein
VVGFSFHYGQELEFCKLPKWLTAILDATTIDRGLGGFDGFPRIKLVENRRKSAQSAVDWRQIWNYWGCAGLLHVAGRHTLFNDDCVGATHAGRASHLNGPQKLDIAVSGQLAGTPWRFHAGR